MSDPSERPPLGLRPRYVVVCLRIQEILEAMQRYATAPREIPREWVDELADLTEWQRRYDSGLTRDASLYPYPAEAGVAK